MGRNLLMLALALSASFLLAEGVLRLRYEPAPIWHEPRTRHLESPLLGWVLPPSSQSFTIDAPVSVNSHGLRDDEIPRAKPDGELRVLCLGDSFTFALGVRFEDLWVQQLEEKLEASHSGPVQVINAGVSGYNTRQELIYLLSEGFSFDPDLVVVGFYWNDLVGNDVPLPDLASTPRLPDDEVVYEPDADVEHTIPGPIRDLLRRSLVFYLGTTRSKGIVQLFRPRTDRDALIQQALLGGDDEFVQPFLDDTGRRLLEIARATRERGIPTVLMMFPMENQVRRPSPEHDLPERIAEIWEPTGMPFLALEEIYRESLEGGTNPYLPYDLHPNRAGMRLAADALSAVIGREQLLALQ